MPQSVTVTVILPTWNEALTLERSIASVREADQILVADGGSFDKTTEIAVAMGCHVLSCPRGRGSQLAVAASHATSRILLILHADTHLAPGSLMQLRELAASQPRLFGGFQQRIEHPDGKFRWIERGNRLRVRCFGWVYGDQGMFIDRVTYDQVGGFESIPFLEDLRISRRLRQVVSPQLLPGPICVSPRRWSQHGLIRQTLRNWMIIAAERGGVSPERLVTWYRPHASESIMKDQIMKDQSSKR